MNDDLVITARDTAPTIEFEGKVFEGNYVYDLVLQGGNGEPDFHIEGTLAEFSNLVNTIRQDIRDLAAQMTATV